MNDLYIRLYLDEDVSVLLASLIRARGFDVLTTREASRLSTSDQSQLLYATEHKRTALTHNRVDFEQLHRLYSATQQHHSGIIIATQHPPHEIARRLLAVLDEVTADEMCDQLRYI